jgi:hypothetical protein
MIEMYKLARPKLHGYPISILNSAPQGVTNHMVNDLLGGMPNYVVDHELIESPTQLAEYQQKLLKQDFTGIVLREPYGVFGHEDEEVPIETAIV